MQIPANAEVAWDSLLTRLRASLPEVADEFMARVITIPAYASDAISDVELRSTAIEMLTMIVDAVADPSNYPRVQTYAAELGEKRALQGVPAEDLTAAVRLDFPMIWGKMIELADEELHPFLAQQAERVWQVVDDYAVACYSSYMSARMRAARFEVSMRGEFISALFTPEGQQPEVQERFARVFQAPANTAYGIIAVNGHPSTLMRETASQKFRYLHEAPSHSFVFWPVRHPESAELYELPDELINEPCGIAFSPEGLGGLLAASRRAVALADHLGSGDAGPLTFSDNWQRLARRSFASSGFSLEKMLDDALLDARSGESDRIKETVVSFLLTGSVADTAEQLFAHRNTVLNRLRRFSDLTGIDLHVPAQSAQVVIAWIG